MHEMRMARMRWRQCWKQLVHRQSPRLQQRSLGRRRRCMPLLLLRRSVWRHLKQVMSGSGRRIVLQSVQGRLCTERL